MKMKTKESKIEPAVHLLRNVIKTLKDAETANTLPEREQGMLPGKHAWTDNPAMIEQSVTYNRIIQMDADGRLYTKSGLQGLIYGKDGTAYIRLRFENAMNVQLQIADTLYSFLEVDKDTWVMVVPEKPGFYYVNLYLDNCRTLSPYLPIGYGFSRPVNYLEIGPVPDYVLLHQVPHGTLRSEYYESSVTGRTESCLVYTPPGYDDSDACYPVLYLHHGFGENERGWLYQGKVHHIMDNLLAEGKAVSMLIVMADGMFADFGAEEEDRMKNDLFAEELVTDILPFIDRKYRTGKGRDCRAAAGLAMGALQTGMAVSRHPELFAWAGFFGGMLEEYLPGHLSGSQRETISAAICHPALELKLVFRAMGKDDIYWKHFLEEDVLCIENGLDYERREYEGGHDWNVWRACIYDFLALLFDRDRTGDGLETGSNRYNSTDGAELSQPVSGC